MTVAFLAIASRSKEASLIVSRSNGAGRSISTLRSRSEPISANGVAVQSLEENSPAQRSHPDLRQIPLRPLRRGGVVDRDREYRQRAIAVVNEVDQLLLLRIVDAGGGRDLQKPPVPSALGCGRIVLV